MPVKKKADKAVKRPIPKGWKKAGPRTVIQKDCKIWSGIMGDFVKVADWEIGFKTGLDEYMIRREVKKKGIKS